MPRNLAWRMCVAVLLFFNSRSFQLFYGCSLAIPGKHCPVFCGIPLTTSLQLCQLGGAGSVLLHSLPGSSLTVRGTFHRPRFPGRSLRTSGSCTCTSTFRVWQRRPPDRERISTPTSLLPFLLLPPPFSPHSVRFIFTSPPIRRQRYRRPRALSSTRSSKATIFFVLLCIRMHTNFLITSLIRS